MHRTRFAPLLFLLVSSLALAETPPQLFQKAKARFRLSAYTECLAVLNELDTDSQRPENASYRAALRPGLAFYRGAALAALGRKEEARSDFEVFLSFQPNAVLDPAVYPRKVIASLEETRQSLRQKSRQPEETGSTAAVYRAFNGRSSEEKENVGEDWAEGPVRSLMTAQERRDYGRLFDAVARSEFVTNFWKTRDPRPETPENEFREEFEKRVAFADANFTENEVRGSLTDRGIVLILIGSPSYVGRKPITTGEDSSDPAGMSRFTRNDIVAALKGVDSRTSTLLYDLMTGPGTKVPDSAANWKEIWHYRREALPKGVPYLQVDFEFITRKGYGNNVLQRDSPALNTLEAARRGHTAGRDRPETVRN